MGKASVGLGGQAGDSNGKGRATRALLACTAPPHQGKEARWESKQGAYGAEHHSILPVPVPVRSRLIVITADSLSHPLPSC